MCSSRFPRVFCWIHKEIPRVSLEIAPRRPIHIHKNDLFHRRRAGCQMGVHWCRTLQGPLRYVDKLGAGVGYPFLWNQPWRLWGPMHHETCAIENQWDFLVENGGRLQNAPNLLTLDMLMRTWNKGKALSIDRFCRELQVLDLKIRLFELRSVEHCKVRQTPTLRFLCKDETKLIIVAPFQVPMKRSYWSIHSSILEHGRQTWLVLMFAIQLYSIIVNHPMFIFSQMVNLHGTSKPRNTIRSNYISE